MKNYTSDSVSVWSDSAVDVQRQMDELKSKGWKGLRLISHNSWGDTRPNEISGIRPMTEQEEKERIKYINKNKADEVKSLRKLAKKYGYKIERDI